MSPTWWGVIGTSVVAFTFKYLGHSVPRKYLEHPRVLRVNALIPVALLSALVAVQTFTEKTKVMIDHRSAGLAVAILALALKAPFPVVVIAAALVSAGTYHFT
ncbi:MAG: AzlD domain-containing protein [Actinobacteria bacterium]|nr:AzlD domain-containing protein [Actinomycetota bacterium]